MLRLRPFLVRLILLLWYGYGVVEGAASGTPIDVGTHVPLAEAQPEMEGYATDPSSSATTRRIGTARWRMYPTKRARQKAYSYQLNAMIRDAVRLARTTDTYMAMFVIPESGLLREFATGMTAVQFLQIYDAMQARSRLSRTNMDLNFATIQREFARGGSWLNDAVQRLGTLGVSRPTLDRFHTVFRSTVLDYPGGSEGMIVDISQRFDHTLTDLVCELESFSDSAVARRLRGATNPTPTEPDDDAVIDLVGDGDPMPPPTPPAATPPAATPPAATPQAATPPATTPPAATPPTATDEASSRFVWLSPMTPTHVLHKTHDDAVRAIKHRAHPDLSPRTLRIAAEAQELLLARRVARPASQQAAATSAPAVGAVGLGQVHAELAQLAATWPGPPAAIAGNGS